MYRGERYHYQDEGKFDDNLQISFKSLNKAVDYRAVLHRHFAEVIEAFKAYRAEATFGLYHLHYCGGLKNTNPVYNRLLADKTIDVDGRNNIYTLEPAQYWDAELCRRALGYRPEDVVRRLRGHALKVEPLMDGVYLVLNDDPQLSYEEFVAMNERYKAMLGLV
jgi:hypothetical protein